MLYPSLKEVKKLSEQYSTIPVFWEISADHWSPLQIYAALSRGEEHSFLLESVNTPCAEWQSWSYIGFASKLKIEGMHGNTMIHAFGNISPAGFCNTRQVAEQFLENGKCPVFSGYPPFTGGFVGAYQYIREEIDPLNCEFSLYDTLVAYDHLKSTAVIIQNLHKGSDLAAQYQAAEIQAAEIAAKIEAFRLMPQSQDDEPPLQAKWMHDDTWIGVSNAPDSFEVYRRLRSRFPAPYLFYVKQGTEIFLGSGNTLTEEFRPEWTIAGFWSNQGIRRSSLPEQGVHYRIWENGERTAGIECRNKEDAEVIVELMRSAKLENTSVN